MGSRFFLGGSGWRPARRARTQGEEGPPKAPFSHSRWLGAGSPQFRLLVRTILLCCEKRSCPDIVSRLDEERKEEMSIRTDLICATATAALLVAGGCALDEEGYVDGALTEKADQAGEEDQAAPEVVEVAEEGEKEKAESGLHAKGPWSADLPSDHPFHVAITVGAYETVTCETTNRTGDPAMALLQRNDGCSGGAWMNCPSYRKVGQFNTLAENDDIDVSTNRNARVSYRNPNGDSQQYLLVGWAWSSSVGTADVTCRFSGSTPTRSWTTENFRAGSLKDEVCSPGSSAGVHTDNLTDHDMSLLVIPINAPVGSGEGRMNDDDPKYLLPDNNARIENLSTSQHFWFIATSYTYASGTSRIICGD